MENWFDFFDYKDGELIWKYRPLELFQNKAGYARANLLVGLEAGNIITSSRSVTKYKQTTLFGKVIKNHRIIYEMFHGEIPVGMCIDHIDGNGLNNKIENLRAVDKVESAHNLPMQKSNKSGVAGVNWHKAANKWQARINYNGKRLDLGRFNNFCDAVRVRREAEKLFSYHINHGRPSNET